MVNGIACAKVVRIFLFPVAIWECREIGRNFIILESLLAAFRSLIVMRIVLMMRLDMAYC